VFFICLNIDLVRVKCKKIDTCSLDNFSVCLMKLPVLTARSCVFKLQWFIDEVMIFTTIQLYLMLTTNYTNNFICSLYFFGKNSFVVCVETLGSTDVTYGLSNFVGDDIQ
jgi:hypothetical protein